MATATAQLLHPTRVLSHVHLSPPSSSLPASRSFLITAEVEKNRCFQLGVLNGRRHLTPVAKLSSQNDGIVSADDDAEDGVSLGTLKLPGNTDLARFEALLFQWANSLCQGANLPLPVPLKVDKIPGGARLGFITLEDGKTEVLVYIDCLVYPATGNSGPLFRAVRNGPLKANEPPGEPRIMRSLLQALKKNKYEQRNAEEHRNSGCSFGPKGAHFQGLSNLRSLSAVELHHPDSSIRLGGH